MLVMAFCCQNCCFHPKHNKIGAALASTKLHLDVFQRRFNSDLNACTRCAHACTRVLPRGVESCSVAHAQKTDASVGDSDNDADCGNNDYADYYRPATGMW